MTETLPHEPSMEEILASIRRIISEDLASVGSGAPGHRAPAPVEADILVLNKPAPETLSIDARAAATDPAPLPMETPAMEPLDPAPPDEPRNMDLAPPAEALDPLAHGQIAPAPPSSVGASPPVSAPTPVNSPTPAGVPATVPATGAAASFERLYFVVENASPPPSPPSPAVFSAGPTLEDLTRDMLKPMIKAWLDENLDAIVRARVDEEVTRIARGRVR